MGWALVAGIGGFIYFLEGRGGASVVADNTPAERVPTVVADGVDIVYRVNGTGAGRGSATAAAQPHPRAGSRPRRPPAYAGCTP